MSEVTKYSVFDPRIVQTKPKYAVEKGSLSITNVSFQAQTATLNTAQWNVQVPSENVFVDRAVEIVGTQMVTFQVTVTSPTGGMTSGTPFTTGLASPATFPIQQSVTQASATINDATVTVNTQDVLPQLLRVADLKDARRQRTCPMMLDKYAVNPDTSAVSNSPLCTYGNANNSDEVPNGGFIGWTYCDVAGVPLSAYGTTWAVVGSTVASGTSYTAVNGQPVIPAATTAGATTLFTLYARWTVAEKLVLPPFIFSDQYELSTGLFGVQNFQVQLNMATSPYRSVRISSNLRLPGTTAGQFGTVALTTAPTWATTATGAQGMFIGLPTLAVQFLTPALDVPLPPKSIVPYMEFPRYITTGLTTLAATNSASGATAGAGTSVLTASGTQYSSQTITLPNIPDLLLIYAKPSSYADATTCDWVFPVKGISINFDNFSGLLANHTQYELYKMSVNNGLDMDWSEWAGQGAIAPSTTALNGTIASGGIVGLVGGPLVLRPGRDFALQAGQAPGLVGNFTLQFQLTLVNQTLASQVPQIYVVPISSGFFETIKGSSRIVKGVLTEQDILGAPAHAPEADMERLVGEGRHHMHAHHHAHHKHSVMGGDGRKHRAHHKMHLYM